MHNNSFIAAIKVDGQILREYNDEVRLPFGSEYSIFLKNYHSRRAKVNVMIDGVSATGGDLILGPQEHLDLERFIKNGNLSSGNRFKFIERTAKVEAHRGKRVDDGYIRVEFKLEKVLDYFWYNSQCPWTISQSSYGGINLGNVSTGGINLGNVSTAQTTNTSNFCMQETRQGITVLGSESQQKFISASDFCTENSTYVITLHLVGAILVPVNTQTTLNTQTVLISPPQTVKVKKPLTVKTPLSCVTCGRKSKSSAKFCADCGTSLVIY